jgi:ligand-binding sensor domain-containing protein
MNGVIMQKTGGCLALFIVFMILASACERTDVELLDPDSAGVWTVYDMSDGLPSNQVSDIKLDRKGNLWFTFPGYGTAMYNNQTWTYYRASTSQILNDAVNCVAETADGQIVFGTSDGLSFLSSDNVWSSYNDPTSTMNINAIKVGSNGWIWVGTNDQGFYVNNGSGFTKVLTDQYKKVNSIEEGIQGNIYLGTDNGIIRWNGSTYSYITLAEGLPSNKISAIKLDKRERLWIGTRNGKTASWLDWRGIHQLNLMAGADSVHIKDIFEDRSGNVWFATRANGLIKYNGVIPYSYKVFNGFPDNNVNCIAEDKSGNLWIGLENKGLVKYTLPINK